MDERDNGWRRTIEPNRALDPTYARPEPWFVGNGKWLMIGILALVGILIAARALTTIYMVEEWYAWWRAPVPTVLPKTLPLAAVPTAPIGNQGDWFPVDSYPAAARRANEEGRVSVALLIGTDGRPVACEVTQSSGSRSLDEATCRLSVRNGRFTPARDTAGRPIQARFAMRGVRWELAE